MSGAIDPDGNGVTSWGMDGPELTRWKVTTVDGRSCYITGLKDWSAEQVLVFVAGLNWEYHWSVEHPEGP